MWLLSTLEFHPIDLQGRTFVSFVPFCVLRTRHFGSAANAGVAPAGNGVRAVLSTIAIIV